ncbi:rhodanese-like domain-containing protein [Biostraticola tofi]|uniref:Rhodanese-related sulfurtransferase n=1 Tax=Biostraticola tofi TaxID=466109 RepID=A0A4R3YLB0_9GAMM|nr:rhodanese-like domain-containing protein [Biostraticola tofi]TCV93001.1 rhodanese-related sulfurtransferase [Biostraticola tofi]
MSRFISAGALKAALHAQTEIALLDIREDGQFGAGHLLLATPLPFSRLELDVAALLPNQQVPIVIYGDDDATASRAADCLAEAGYLRVSLLSGGIQAWIDAGYGIFAGVNVPSKAFGEQVESSRHTPHVSAAQLSEWQQQQRPLVLLDGRTLAEHQKMSIPGSVGCPNGELVLRWRKLVPDSQTPIVVHCAGRTRSIIGAQTLIDLGIPNPIYALEDGTQGWFLAGFRLMNGNRDAFPHALSDHDYQAARNDSYQAAPSVPTVSVSQASSWLHDRQRTTYIFDIRTEEEFSAGTLLGARHAPGGQLIQATDAWIAVRQGRIILLDEDDGRARVIAGWLQLMGYQAWVLDTPVTGAAGSQNWPAPITLNLPLIATLGAKTVAELVRQQRVLVVDLRASQEFNLGTLPDAIWSRRPLIQQHVNELVLQKRYQQLILVADSMPIAALAASELDELPITIAALEGGVEAWQQAGLPLVAPRNPLKDEQRIDFLFFTAGRHDGDAQAARHYLSWEKALLAQMDEQERATISGRLTQKS